MGLGIQHSIMWGNEEVGTDGKGESTGRDTSVWTSVVYGESCSLHGAFHQRAFNTATWNTRWKQELGMRTRVITGTVGSCRVMRECSMCDWQILPFCGFIWIIKRVYRRSSALVLTHVLCIVTVVQTHTMDAKMAHHVLYLPAAPTCTLGIMASHHACLHIVHRWQSWPLWWSQPKPKGKNYSFSVQGKIYISEKPHEECSFQKKKKHVSP